RKEEKMELKKVLLVAVATVGLAVGSATTRASVLVDFEDYPHGVDDPIDSSYQPVSGLTITWPDNLGIWVDDENHMLNYATNTDLASIIFDQPVTIHSVDGQFWKGLDFTIDLYTNPGDAAPALSVTSDNTSWETFNTESAGAVRRLDLSAVETEANFDNILLTVVPEPASVALLGVGGLAMLTRRRQKA
ncbi:MAG: PEP-CTERM sorting domain-containing protein, partial [Phycisphaeraceae bacterium]